MFRRSEFLAGTAFLRKCAECGKTARENGKYASNFKFLSGLQKICLLFSLSVPHSIFHPFPLIAAQADRLLCKDSDLHIVYPCMINVLLLQIVMQILLNHMLSLSHNYWDPSWHICVVYLDFPCCHSLKFLVVKNVRNSAITSCYIVFLIIGIVAWLCSVWQYDIH